MKIEACEGGARFTVRVQPRASRSGIVGPYGDGIKIRLAAPPVEGAANRALVSFLSRVLGIPKSSVGIVRGDRSRTKTVEVIGIDLEAVRRKLEPDGP